MNKKVTEISHGRSDVSVKTADGATYTGNLVVGADGVHSTVREEMWRLGSLNQPDFVTEEVKSGEQTMRFFPIGLLLTFQGLSAEYGCVFGVCKAPPGQDRWEHIIRYNQDFCFLFFPATGTDIFFNVIFKFKRKYRYPNIPRFSKADAVKICESVVDFPVWNNIKFGDLWEQRLKFALVPLEEHMFKNWHYRRIVCLGDSVSKVGFSASMPDLGY